MVDISDNPSDPLEPASPPPESEGHVPPWSKEVFDDLWHAIRLQSELIDEMDRRVKALERWVHTCRACNTTR